MERVKCTAGRGLQRAEEREREREREREEREREREGGRRKNDRYAKH